MLNRQPANTREKPFKLLWLQIIYVGLFFSLAIYGVIRLANFISIDEQAQILVREFGYLGVLLISYISGLNAIVPVPAGAFVPIFTAAELWLPMIIFMLVLGTTLADLTAYFTALLGKTLVTYNYPKITYYTELLHQKSTLYVATGIFLYSTLSPLPNELILVPLALLGVRLRTILLPLLLGTIIYQSFFAFFAQGIMDYFF